MTNNNDLSPLAQPFAFSKSASSSDDDQLNPHAQPFTATNLTVDSVTAQLDKFHVGTSHDLPINPDSFTHFPPATADQFTHQVLGMPPNFLPAMPADRFDIRMCPQKDRKLLVKGDRIVICKGDIPVIEMPYPLFLATSNKPDLLFNGVINLPHDIDARGVVLLITYMNKMACWRQTNLRMRHHTMDIYDMLSVTAAAALLGMDPYTSHIYRKCEAVLHNDLPAYEDLDAVTYFAHEHPRLLHILAARNLAVKMREGGIPDQDDFAAYLARNQILGAQIQMAHVRHNEWVGRVRQRELDEHSRVQRAVRARAAHERARVEGVERARKREQFEQGREQHEQVQAKWAAEREQRAKDKADEDKKFWAEKKKEGAEDEKSIQEKVKLAVEKRKFTLRERAHWRNTRGTKLPKGC